MCTISRRPGTIGPYYVFCPICGLTLWFSNKNKKIVELECEKCGWNKRTKND